MAGAQAVLRCTRGERVGGCELVSAADKLANVRETLHDVRVQGDGVFERFAGKKEGTLWYYRALVGEFHKAGDNSLIEELDRAVTDWKRKAARDSGLVTI